MEPLTALGQMLEGARLSMYSPSTLTNWGPAALISAPESGRMSREACPWHVDTCMLRPLRDKAFVN